MLSASKTSQSILSTRSGTQREKKALMMQGWMEDPCGPFTGTQTQSDTCKVTPQITALSYLCQRYLRSDTCKVTGVIVQEITVGIH